MYIVCRMIVLHVSINITNMWILGCIEKWPGEEIHKDSSELQAANRGHYQAPGEGQEIKERGGSPEEAGESHREDGANSGETAQRQEQEVHRSVCDVPHTEARSPFPAFYKSVLPHTRRNFYSPLLAVKTLTYFAYQYNLLANLNYMYFTYRYNLLPKLFL